MGAQNGLLNIHTDMRSKSILLIMNRLNITNPGVAHGGNFTDALACVDMNILIYLTTTSFSTIPTVRYKIYSNDYLVMWVYLFVNRYIQGIIYQK